MSSASDLDGLPLERRVSRLFWVVVHGAAGHVPHPGNQPAYGVQTPVEVVRRHHPGGVVLFTWAGNTEHPDQVARLTGDLREAASGSLGVAIDEEGGRITRLPPPAARFPSARAVAAAADDDLAMRRWRAGASELAAIGVTTNLAPVVDLGHPVNPVLGDRTFADEPQAVARHAALAVRGLHAGGVAAVAKHFPGHGASAVDSHEALPVVPLARAALEPHLDAFRRLVAAEPPAGIMTAHLLVRALDPSQPATLSARVLTGVLRRDLGYGGAIVTDSLSMAGIRTREDDGEVAVAALAAGADVLLTPPDLEGAMKAVCRAVRDGRLAEERVDDALRRAASLVRRGDDRDASGVAAPRVGVPDHVAVAVEIARRAIRVAADPSHRLPLTDGHVVVVGAVGSGARGLADALRRRGRSTALREGPLDGGRPDLAAGGRPDLAAKGPEAALVLVRRAPELDGPTQDALLAPLARGHHAPILVETGSARGPWAGGESHLTVVLTHGSCESALDAAADVLTATRRP